MLISGDPDRVLAATRCALDAGLHVNLWPDPTDRPPPQVLEQLGKVADAAPRWSP
jgi:hypothetical protein